MQARDFCFWLQGFFEINEADTTLTPRQCEIIKKHLALAFVHDIDPSMGDKVHQAKLNGIHMAPINLHNDPNIDNKTGQVIDETKPVMRC